MGLVVYANGQWVAEDAPVVNLFDHGLLYGDGVFEGIRCYSGRVFKLKQHLDRMFRSARAIHLKIPHTKEEFTEIILETCRRNSIQDGYIRPLVTRGTGDLGLDPRRCKEPNVYIIARPFSGLYGDIYDTGLKLITSSWRRTPPECLSPNVKCLNYLNNILAKIEANNVGAHEAIMLDMQGFVCEATADNFFVVHEGEIMTPHRGSILIGVTRDTVFELAEKRGIAIEEANLSMYDVYGADEVFITGTAAEVAPVVEVDGRSIGEGKPGKITKTLMADYTDYVRGTGTPIYR